MVVGPVHPFPTLFAQARMALLAVAILTLGTATLCAAVPQLNSLTPWGAQRGTEVEVQFAGDRLGDAQQILLYEPGIAVAHLEAAGPNLLKVKLALSADCRLGMHAVRVRTASGISNLRTFSVGALKEVAEVEPNNDFAQPQKISLDTTVNGVADNEDVDYFQVEAKKGERITAEVEGMRLGNTFFDPYVSILDMRRFELARSDDSPLLRQDCVCSILAPQDGSYVVQVRESAFAGNGSCRYRLHVGRFPRPTAVLPAGGKPGETLDVRWIGDLAGERVEKITLPPAPVSSFGLFARDERGVAPSANPFRICDLGNVLEIEPNNDAAHATPFTAPMALGGVISQPGDFDTFKFPAKKGEVYDVRVLARSLGSPLDSVLYIDKIGGGRLAGNDDNGGPDSYIRFTAPEDGEYAIVITDHLGKGGPDYAYRIEVTPVKPALALGLPERSPYVDITAPVPQGNRLALLISASRADFGGELNLEFKDLPPGVTVEAISMPANRGDIPVLLSAAPGAALAGALVDVVGRHADPKLPVEGRLRQRSSLIRGQNNIEVWNHYTERLAVAVTQESPFRIDVVEPKVPIVRNGAMELKVVATRRAGFVAPIAVRMLYDPPGISSSGSIVIPEGKNEITIPLNANGGAEIRKWRIAVMGEAAVGDGPLLVSSQLATLDVAEPFVAFNFQAAATEQGKPTDVVIKIAKARDFEGTAKVELLGLPNEVTSEVREITKDTTELVFPLKTTAKSPPGKHKTLLCRAVIMAQGEPIAHGLGPGELRIDVPLPPKANEPPPTPVPAPVAAAPPAEKRLSRLEKLRLDRQTATAPAPAPKPVQP